MFPLINRLKNKIIIDGVEKWGKTEFFGDFLLKYQRNDLKHPTFLIKISKKKVPLATQRNQIRRIVSEKIRTCLSDIGGFDVIIIFLGKLIDSEKLKIKTVDIVNYLANKDKK